MTSLTKRLALFFTLSLLDYAAVLLCIAFILAGSLISVHRYWQFDSFYYDFGVFDQALWKVAHFQPPIIDHLVVGGKWIFADHFNPSIFLLSPLYWFTDKRESILIAQAIIVGLSGLVLYMLGKIVIKNQFYSLAILLCFFLFVGLQNAVITDFHEITIQTLPFMLTYFFFLKKKLPLFFVMLIITLGCKESSFLLGIGVGISLFFLTPSLWKISLFTILISLFWGFISIYFIIPFFSGGVYQYGVTPSYNPIQIASSFIDHPIKFHTLLYSFLSFGFLPLLSYQFWFLLFQDFLTRFYSPQWFTRFDLGLHYSAPTAAIMGISSIFSLCLLQKYITKKIILTSLVSLLVLNALYIYRVKLHGPFALAYNPQFYAHTKDFVFLNTLIEKVPNNASVMAQNNLAVRFTHQQVWTLQSDPKLFVPDYYVQKKPDYILLDTRDGQNPNNHFLIKDLSSLLKALQQDSNYKIAYATEEQFLFHRIK